MPRVGRVGFLVRLGEVGSRQTGSSCKNRSLEYAETSMEGPVHMIGADALIASVQWCEQAQGPVHTTKIRIILSSLLYLFFGFCSFGST